MRTVQMNLLFDDIEVIESAGDPTTVEISGIAHDSRRVVPGDLFCCVPGLLSDGHAYAAEAVDRGAVGLLCEHFIPELLDQPVVQTRIAPGTARPVMARLAAAFYGHPARDLLMVGVTGTNGKTTVTQILGDLLDAAGRPTNVMGTLSGARTTPEATEVQRVLAGVRDRQRADGRPHAVAMEVSSHALVQSRVDGVHFDVAVFTNLSHDHLDYHGDMESYYEAKRLLFTPDHALRGIVNGDDPWGRRLMKEARIPVTAVHLRAAHDIELRPGQTSFTWRSHRITTPLTGTVNVGNTLLAAEAALSVGLEVDEVARALALISPVPGRLEVVATPSGDVGDPDRPPFTVLVDYAHTPAGLEVVLHEARQLADVRGRVLVVFGCGGNRDTAKRPKMGQVASSLSDVAVLTSDNPRDEDPLAIMAEVRAGMTSGPASASGSGSGSTVIVEADRRAAIRRALADAAAGDVVVIAGKGHETYQEVCGQRIPFNDVDEARQALSVHFPSDPLSWRPFPDRGASSGDH
jgi:UDP-N-acetylmuramoyl-L-alanyl-D-glutamate--2,6-diaminopimelate ligase